VAGGAELDKAKIKEIEREIRMKVESGQLVHGFNYYQKLQ
jgi:hypothetical protein